MWPPLVQLWKHLERRQAGALARTRAGLPARRTTPLDPRLGRVRAAGELRRRFVPGGVVNGKLCPRGDSHLEVTSPPGHPNRFLLSALSIKTAFIPKERENRLNLTC